MQTTIDGDNAWEYIDVLNECLRIVLTVLLGMVFGYFGILNHKAVVPVATRLVFYVCLPMLVIRGLVRTESIVDVAHMHTCRALGLTFTTKAFRGSSFPCFWFYGPLL